MFRAKRQLHNPSNVRYLIRLIDDPWPETRLEAMRGLQELVRPGLEEHGWVLASQYRELDSAEKEVVARWRAWWEKEGKTKYGK